MSTPTATVDGTDMLTVLDLNCRITNRLGADGIFRVGELCRCSADDLTRLPGFGKRSLQEVQEALQRVGRSLRGGEETA